MTYTREQIEHYIGSVEVLAKVCTEITVDTSGIRMLRQLLAENDALREDAERYRWLRKERFFIREACQYGPAHPMISFSYDIWSEKPSTHNSQGLDAAIDAARKKN